MQVELAGKVLADLEPADAVAVCIEPRRKHADAELARQYDVGYIDPNIEVVDVDLAGDQRLMLRHVVVKGAQLNEINAKRVLQHLADLWTYDVSLVEVDAKDNILKEYVVSPRALAAAA